ncbi:MAG: succinyldiaminopimelate transaminase [Casimicrobiaceae bacterium]
MNPYLTDLNEFTFTRLARLLSGNRPPAALAPIDLSIGEPKHPTPMFIREALAQASAGLAQYPPTKGSAALRSAIATWLSRRFHLPHLDPESHGRRVWGSTAALYRLTPLAVHPRRARPTVVMPNPLYMVYEGAATLCGAQPYFVNRRSEGGHAWDEVPDSVWADTQMLIVCSPDNPTGDITPRATWQRLFERSDRYGFVIVADECYSEIYFDESRPPAGALQVAQELGRSDFRNLIRTGSLSKRSNAPGLRSGYVAGDARWIAAFLKLRAFNGSAMSATVAAASIAAWGDEAHVIENRAAYARKFRELTPRLASLLGVEAPMGAFYWWARIPKAWGDDDEAFTRELYAATGVTVIPGSYLSRTAADGTNPGNGHVRIALVAEFDTCAEAVDRIAAFVKTRGH